MTDQPCTTSLAAAPTPDAASPAPRHDGWTLARQRRFCELLAEHGNVGEAARRVGMSKQSAYSLRRRAAGAAFALGWDAAIGIARRRLIDDALELLRSMMASLKAAVQFSTFRRFS